MAAFPACRIFEEGGRFGGRTDELRMDDLDETDLLIRTCHAGVNDKDATVGMERDGIAKGFPRFGAAAAVGSVAAYFMRRYRRSFDRGFIARRERSAMGSAWPGRHPGDSRPSISTIPSRPSGFDNRGTLKGALWPGRPPPPSIDPAWTSFPSRERAIRRLRRAEGPLAREDGAMARAPGRVTGRIIILTAEQLLWGSLGLTFEAEAGEDRQGYCLAHHSRYSVMIASHADMQADGEFTQLSEFVVPKSDESGAPFKHGHVFSQTERGDLVGRLLRRLIP